MKSPSGRIANTSAAHRRLTFAVPSPPPLPRLLPRRHASATPLPHFCHTFATLLPHFTTPPHLCHTISVFLAVSLSSHLQHLPQLPPLCCTFAARLPRTFFGVSISFAHVHSITSLSCMFVLSCLSLCLSVTQSSHLRHTCRACATPVPHLCHTSATPGTATCLSSLAFCVSLFCLFLVPSLSPTPFSPHLFAPHIHPCHIFAATQTPSSSLQLVLVPQLCHTHLTLLS